MNKINFKSTRASLLFLVLLIFIPFIVIVFHSAHQYRVSNQKFASENALRVARNLSQQQKLIENNAHQFLEILSQLPDIKSGDTTKINRLLETFLQKSPSYASLFLTNKNGVMIASGLPFVGLNVSDRKYFIDVLQTKSFAVGEYARGRLTRKPVIHYAYPVLNKDSTVQSILCLSFELKYYDEVFKKSDLGKDASFTFVDHRGVILYQSANLKNSVGLSDTDEILTKINGSKTESTFVATGNDGKNRLYGYEEISLKEGKPYMYIYVGVPEEVAYSEFRKVLSINLIMWTLSAIIVVIVAYLFSLRFIIKPIDQLVKTTGYIAEGKLETRTGIADNSTEIGKLAKAIDEMTDNLYRREMEQKKTQKDLRRLKERFELSINSAQIGIWDWHIRNNTLLWDKNMLNLYGIKHDEFDFRFESWMTLIHPDDVPYIEKEINTAIAEFRNFRSEFRIIHPTEGIKHIRIFANVIPDKEGTPVRLIGVNWDITERKSWEQKLHEAKEKAETSDRLKSSFLANISHEIRTPLHGIIGFAQILKGNEITSAERGQFLDIIVDSGNKLMNIISNIIDISMLDAGQIKVQNSDCNVALMIKELFEAYDKLRIAKEKKFNFVLDLEVNDSLNFSMDGYRFRQIFSNLIENAFKFTETGEICVGCRIFNEELLCYVKDTGIGISRENLLKIFERFKQLDENNNRVYSGNGLGLAICKGLLDVMKGRIWAVSKETGSEFYFSIPLKSLKIKETIDSSEQEDGFFA